MSEHLQAVKPFGEIVSLGSLLGWLFGLLPAIATLLTIIYYSILIYDRFRSSRRDRSQDGTHY